MTQMPSFKKFLLGEEKVSQFKHEPLESAKEVALAIKQHCSQAWKAYNDDIRIFRGWKGERPMGIYNPYSGQRTSKNTTNHYTALLDSNPKNHKWPPRANSFICTTHRGTASGYGTPHVIFVFDGVDIGEVNSGDIWHLRLYFPDLSFENTIIGFNKFWDRLDAPETNMKEMIAYIKQLDPELVLKELQSRFYHPPAGTPANEVVDRLVSDIPDAYSYEDLKCTLNSIDKVGRGEMWFSGKCVMVPADKMTDVWAAMKELK